MCKKIIKLISVCVFGLCSVFSFAGSKTLVIGGENGWGKLSTRQGVTTGRGRFGYESIELSTQTPSNNDATDLLLTFDGSAFADATGHYTITKNTLVKTSDAIKGKGAALCRGSGMSLSGDATSIFGRKGLAGSFTFEFYLNPTIAENGETVFSWKSSLNAANYSEYQMIAANFANNHIEWTFRNIFAGYKDSEFVLAGTSIIVPKAWARHTLSFDEETGCLEYCVDGQTEAIMYVTKNCHENGTVCYPILGVKAQIEICPKFTGKVDNFRITRTAYQKTSGDVYSTGNEKYKVDGGKIMSQPILVSTAATLNSVDALMNVPEQTDIRLYVRSSDNCYGWTDSYPAWKEVLPGEEIYGVEGLYFQVAAELLPDGWGTKTPSITQLSLNYTEQEAPLPPFTVYAEGGDGCVTLTWSYSVDDTADGYYIYYGNRSGEYLGRTALEGPSPVRAGNTTSITLNGLNNGTIYYFAVSAYSKVDGRINGTLSKEVFARPSARISMR